MLDQNLSNIFFEIIKIEGLSRNEKDVADFIKNFLSNYSYRVHQDNSKIISKSNTGNLIIEINGGGDFILMSHMDTARSTKGVKPICREDRITSDGTTVLGVDNRAGVSILLFLLQYIKEKNIATKGFSVGFTTCEETTLAGSKNIDLNKNIKNGFIFDSYLPSGSIVNNSFGAISFKIEFIGKAAHSGIEPEKGTSSIHAVAKLIAKLELGRIDDNLTINIGKINGGTAVNVIPEKTIVEGEIRARTKELGLNGLNLIIKKFENAADEFNCKMSTSYNWEFEPYTVEENNKTFIQASEAIAKVGLKPLASTSWGGSDANSLNAKGISTVNLGIGAKNPHSNDEYILYKDFTNSFNIALELVKA